MSIYYLDIQITVAHGHQTYSVEAKSLKEAGRKFKAYESMKFEDEEIEVEGLEEVDDSDLDTIYQ